MDESPPPPILYKFRSWNNENHRKLLTERKLWVPCATKLNDPFDCSIPFRYDKMKYNDLVNRLVQLRSEDRPGVPIEDITSEVIARIDDLGIRDPHRNAEVLVDFTEFEKRRHAVLSFAGVRDNPLLWSHYADKYSGFCVAIDSRQIQASLDGLFDRTDVLSFGFRIQYVPDMPVIIPPPEISSEEDADARFRILTTKSCHWSHEKEYRYVFAGAFDFAIELRPSCVAHVILGSEMPTEDKCEIRKHVKAQFPEAAILQACKNPMSFELDFL